MEPCPRKPGSAAGTAALGAPSLLLLERSVSKEAGRRGGSPAWSGGAGSRLAGNGKRKFSVMEQEPFLDTRGLRINLVISPEPPLWPFTFSDKDLSYAPMFLHRATSRLHHATVMWFGAVIPAALQILHLVPQ